MNKDITIREGKLFFGKYEVDGYEVEDGKPLLKQFAIRVYDGKYWNLVTTMDIVDEYIWLCGFNMKEGYNGFDLSFPTAYYNSWNNVEYILNKICPGTRGKEWEIFPDPVDTSWPTWDEYPDDEEYE